MSADAASLAGRTVGAGMWTVGARLFAKLIDLAMMMCLARFLGPSAFALVAAAMAVVFIVEALFELPMASALIRAPVLEPEMLHTAFTLGLLRGLCIGVALASLAWPLALLNHEPRLLPLLCVLALAPAIRGLLNPRMVEFARRLDFRPDALLELSGKTAALLVSVTLAATTGSYWAIAAATVSAPLVSTSLSWLLAPLRPRLALSRWPYFSGLVGWNFVAQLANALNWQVDRLLLPRFVAAGAFGQYAMAKQVSEIPQQALLAPLQRPLMAALSNAPADLARRYLHGQRAIVLVMVPVLALLMACPEPLVRIALGPQWLAAAGWLRALAAISLLLLPTTPMAALAIVLNKPRAIGMVTCLALLVKLPLLWLGAHRFGVAGVLGANALATAIGTALGLLVVRQLVGIGIGRQLAVMGPPLLAVAPGALLMAAASRHLMALPGMPALLACTAVLGACYLALYVLGVVAGWHLRGRPSGLERHLLDRLLHRLAPYRNRRDVPTPP